MALVGFPENIAVTLGSVWTGLNGLSPGSVIILKHVGVTNRWTEDGTDTPNISTNRLKVAFTGTSFGYSMHQMAVEGRVVVTGGFSGSFTAMMTHYPTTNYDYTFKEVWNYNQWMSIGWAAYRGVFNTYSTSIQSVFSSMAEAPNEPLISVAPYPLRLWTKPDGSPPDPTPIEISNPGLANLNAVITSPTNSWISVTDGTVPELAPGGSNDDATVVITHNETITWGEQNDGSITVTDAAATNSPVVHPVKYMAGMTKAVKSSEAGGDCRGFGITAFPMANAVNSTGLTIQWLMKKDEFNPWQNAMESFFNVNSLASDGNLWAFRLWYRGVASNLYQLTYGNPQFWNGYHRTKLYQLGPTDHNVSPLQGYLGTGWHLFTARIRNEANTSDDLDLFVDGVKLTGSAWNNSGTASGASPAGDYPLTFGHGLASEGYLTAPPNCSFQHPAVFPTWLSDADIEDLAALFDARDVAAFEAGLIAKGTNGAWRIGDADIETIVALSTPTFNATSAYGLVPTANQRLQEPGYLLILPFGGASESASASESDPAPEFDPGTMIMSRGF